MKKKIVEYERHLGTKMELFYTPQCEQIAVLCCCLWR